MSITRHAVYATQQTPTGDVTFRVGQPADWRIAQARWDRLDKRRPKVRHARRNYAPTIYEVRAVDAHGRGLGAIRHAQAIAVPYRSIR